MKFRWIIQIRIKKIAQIHEQRHMCKKHIFIHDCFYGFFHFSIQTPSFYKTLQD